MLCSSRFLRRSVVKIFAYIIPITNVIIQQNKTAIVRIMSSSINNGRIKNTPPPVIHSPKINSGNSANYYQNPRQDILFNFSEIHPDEVIHQLANLKISKSTGIDNIPAKALKIAANIIGPSLTWIFNLSIKTGIYVDEWKKARVVPIYKSGNRQKCENYRQFRFYLSLVKYLRSVFNQIYKFLNDNSLLSKYQSGFRPKNSTLTALIQMCDTLYENMDNGELNGVVFLDIRKAFDAINHTILLHKMKVQFGITNVELDWFSSYLTNREQVCLVNGITSTPTSFVVSRRDQFWVPYCTLTIYQIVLIKPPLACMQMILRFCRQRKT